MIAVFILNIEKNELFYPYKKLSLINSIDVQ
ncbi:hypothetical protein FHR29_004961 [Sphingobacterium sp. JUb56]|nr:hypothetical protein [Sphingobacterium sp. JUb56]